MIEEYRALTEGDVVVGQPLRFSVFDESKTLLLSKGNVVTSEHQRERLLKQKVFISLKEERQALEEKSRKQEAKNFMSVFEWVDGHYKVLSKVYQTIHTGDDKNREKIQLIAERIYRLSEKHGDGLLAACQLSEGKIYSHIKALHVALLCEALGRRAGLNASVRLPMIAAGLTHDLGMWKLQEEIRLCKDPLTDKQWHEIREHTDKGQEILQACGIGNKLWLDTVGQHHERLDGTGYPKGLKEEQILPSARILAIADTFAAMVRPRGDRDELMCKDAMRDIFLDRGKQIDATLAQLFIKELGLFAPGSIVRLVTNEIGVVTGAGNVASSPDVEVIIDAKNRPLQTTIYRDTSQKNFAVSEIINKPDHPNFDAVLSGMWPRVPKFVQATLQGYFKETEAKNKED